ncbi:MAG: tetratricopeptide repeat protein [Candidatus Erginobacter occultus]|nr:tetratricopeptide repeat protein [Candidatus Erginobacter occultus]
MESPTSSKRWQITAAALILIAAGALAYSNSFRGAFVFDDIRAIVNNPHIRQILPLSQSLSGPWDSAVRDRPVVSFTLALNYALGGLAPWGYHLFNLTVHLLAGLTLFGILRRTFGNSRFSPAFNRSATGLGFAAALIWLLHPLQTESITYVIQRSESLAGLFYLLTLYCFIRGADSERGRTWFAGAVLGCGLGLATKATMITAPVAVFLYDSIFLSRSPARAVKRHWRWHLALASTWLIQILLISRTSYGDLKGLSPLAYLFTQPSVIAHFLRLIVWPHPLCLDYGWPLAAGVMDVLPAAAVIGALLWLTIYGLFKKPTLGFAGAWFFLILAPTSSLLPLEDPAFEHRMYLPLAAITALAAGSVFNLLRRLHSRAGRRTAAVVILTAAALLLGSLTFLRNRIYHDPLQLWREITILRPEHARGYYNYGLELGKTGRRAEEIEQYREAVRLKPGYAFAYNNLASALVDKGELLEAVRHYGRAIRINPRYWEARYNLGMALSRLDKVLEALTAFEETIRIQPSFAPAYFQAGETLRKLGRHREAAAYYRKAIELNPAFISAIRERAVEAEQTGDRETARIYREFLDLPSSR